jgi:hypothetical protein
MTEHLFPDGRDIETALISPEITLKEINYYETNSVSQNNLQNLDSHSRVAEE